MIPSQQSYLQDLTFGCNSYRTLPIILQWTSDILLTRRTNPALIRIILISWIRIRIRVKSWIRIRIKVEFLELKRLKMEPWRAVVEAAKSCIRIKVTRICNPATNCINVWTVTITSNVPVVFMARYVMVLRSATSLLGALEGVGLENRDIFGP